MKTTLSVLLIVSLFAYWSMDKYKYYDFSVENCSAPVEVKLIGDYSAENPVVRRDPYYLSFAISESNSNIGAGSASIQLIFQPFSKNGSTVEISEKNEVFLIEDRKVLLIKPINIDYADYHLKVVVKQLSADENIVECKVRRNYSEEIRFRPWDILLSV